MQLFDRIRLGIAVAVAKTVTAVVKGLRLGAASVLPGKLPVVSNPVCCRYFVGKSEGG